METRAKGIIAYGFILLLGRAGFITQLLSIVGADPAVVGAFIYSPPGLGLAYSYYLIPRVVLVVLPAIRNFDQNQILASRSLGATPGRAVFDIMLPQLAPSLVAAFCPPPVTPTAQPRCCRQGSSDTDAEIVRADQPLNPVYRGKCMFLWLSVERSR